MTLQTSPYINLAFAGEFDRIMSAFANWMKSPSNHRGNLSMIGLANRPHDDIDPISWRLGSLVSTQTTASMLDNIQVLVYFCLTPTDERRTDEGYARDIEITAAFNLAQQAKQHPECHVILVMRSFPDDQRKYHDIYGYWQKILNTFTHTCSNLTVIRTAPVLSELDAFCVALAEHATRMSIAPDNADLRWLNHTQPVDIKSLFSCIHDHFTNVQTPETIFLKGNRILTYGEWLQQTKHVLAKQNLVINRLRGILEPEAYTRSQLLEETIEFPTADLSIDISQSPQHTPLNIESDIETVLKSHPIGHPLRLRPSRHPENTQQTSSYVVRILSNPKKNVSEVTDLLMQWLPRFFQRAVRVDTIGDNRLLCRLSRIPLLELEKRVESPTRCRLLLRNPWGAHVQVGSSLLVTITGTTQEPGELLVIVEDSPGFKPFNMGFRAILASFGRYLKDYGCGN